MTQDQLPNTEPNQPLRHLSSANVEGILKTMILPDNRKHLTGKNITWLHNNIELFNRSHPRFNDVMEYLKYRLSEANDMEPTQYEPTGKVNSVPAHA